ncbi:MULTISPECIES: hypothetical protein [unclassified Streptomyces]|uniref:hypothetical protein n=1 Tax=unclassified Streptomyces TaxID=2593676 RepID=UPI0013707EF4|nr:hypothetical protein [Streptomyces sp. YIM 132580]MXG30223.1 hypothetical protein [Streptomyces sp. YIM 132580]NYS21404.1 hypothetical protein [Streptomyces sp. SJ1-7]
MRPFRTTLATAAALTAATAGVLVAHPVQPAHASASDCESGARGFRDHPDNAEGDTDKPADFSLGSVRITLEKGSYVGQQIAFGKISGQTRPGDNVWMDWRADGWDRDQNAMSPWLQCGPFTVRSAGQSLTTPFRRTSTDPQYQFRVCGSLKSDGVIRCSGWW